MTVPSPPHYAGPPSFEHPGPAKSRAWRFANSLWLVIPVVGFGCLSGLPLIFLGVLTRRRGWWIPGILYTVLASSSFVVVGITTETEEPDASASNVWSDISVWVLIFTWLACIIHSAIINSAWLQWRAGHVPWFAQPVTPSAPAMPAGGYAGYATTSILPADVVPPPSVYYGPNPVAASPTPAASREARLDLNTATVDQLAALPGLDRQAAQRIVSEREARGGFLALTDLVDLVDLEPHEFARIRDLMTCTPRPQPDSPRPSVGRIVDV